MKRKLILCLLATVLVLSLPATRTMASSPVPVQVDGTTLSGTSYLLGSVTYVPLRALLNAFGGWDVAWEGKPLCRGQFQHRLSLRRHRQVLSDR
mgnify:CR=1 FL=1